MKGAKGSVWEGGIHPNEITIPELLKQANYATQAIGKWHLGDAREFLPTRNGFDHWLSLPYSNDMWPYHPKVTRAGPENDTAKAVRERAEETGFDGQGQHYPSKPVSSARSRTALAVSFPARLA